MAKNWEGRLLRSKGGGVIACPANIISIITHSEEWKGVLGYDQFVDGVVVLKNPPWHRDARGAQARLGDWHDSDTTRLSDWLSRTKYHVVAPPGMIEAAIHVVAERNAFHPVRQWLESLDWDGKPRAKTWAIRIGGADDNDYVKAVSQNFLVGAVARIYAPGCKVDTVPIFEGAQGVGKSTMLRILFGEAWFLETGIELGGKDSFQILRRKWGVELSELDSLGRSENSRTKAFVSARVDTYRPSYGRGTRDFPRQCVFAGTVNPEGGGYLKDNTGARRFLPVVLRRMHFKALEEERDQLWAEALQLYRSGEAWHLQDPTLVEAQRAVAEERRQQDPWEAEIAKFIFSKRVTARTGVTTHYVLTHVLGLKTNELTRSEEMRVGSILRLIGLTDTFRSTEPGRPRMYRLPPGTRVKDIEGRLGKLVKKTKETA